MISRRGFFGAMAGSAAAATVIAAAPRDEATSSDMTVPGWEIVWSGWKEPVNQFVRFGFWWARRNPMPYRIRIDDWSTAYSTTLGVLAPARDMYVIDTTWADKTQPILPTEPVAKFAAAKAAARTRLVERLLRLGERERAGLGAFDGLNIDQFTESL